MRATVLLVPLLLAVGEACNPFTETGGLGDILRGISVGLVSLQGAPPEQGYFGSDCYRDTDTLASKLSLFYSSLSALSLPSALAPLLYLNQLFVDASHVMQTCNALNFIGQVALRTRHLSGLTGFLYTLADEVLSNGLMRQAAEQMAENQVPCLQYGFDIGVIVSEGLNYRAPYYDQVARVFNLNITNVNLNTTLLY